MDLFEYIKRKGVSVQSLADALGISRQAAYLKIGGARKWTLEEAHKVKRFLNMTDEEYMLFF